MLLLTAVAAAADCDDDWIITNGSAASGGDGGVNGVSTCKALEKCRLPDRIELVTRRCVIDRDIDIIIIIGLFD